MEKTRRVDGLKKSERDILEQVADELYRLYYDLAVFKDIVEVYIDSGTPNVPQRLTTLRKSIDDHISTIRNLIGGIKGQMKLKGELDEVLSKIEDIVDMYLSFAYTAHIVKRSAMGYLFYDEGGTKYEALRMLFMDIISEVNKTLSQIMRKDIIGEYLESEKDKQFRDVVDAILRERF